MNVYCVPPNYIQTVWKEVEPLLEKSISLGRTHSSEDIRKDLLTARSALWVQVHDQIEAAIISEFVSYPRGLWLRVWLAGARAGGDVDWGVFAKLMNDWAKVNGAIELEVSGRPGWVKLFNGSRCDWHVLRIEVK